MKRSFFTVLALLSLLAGGSAWAFPKIANFSPRTGGPGTVVTITGTDLGSVASVNFGGGSVATITGRNTSSVTVIVPPDVINGPINITDLNGFGDDTGAHNLPDFLAPPRITGFARLFPTPSSPAESQRGAPGNTIRITGANFNSTTDITFEGTVFVGFTTPTGTTFVAPASNGVEFLDAIVPVGAISGPLTVVTRIGRISTTADFYLQPFISRFTAVAAVGQTNELVGVSLKGATQVLFGDVAVVPKNVTSTNILVVVPPVAGPVFLTVITPGGAYRTTTQFNLLPTIESFDPPGGPITTTVTIKGSGLATATKLRFAGVDSPILTATATEATAKVPLGAVTGKLTVITGVGTNTTSGLFYLPPKLTSLTPNRAKVGTQITLAGTSLTGLTGVQFGGTNADFTVIDDLTVKATVPTGAITGPVVVANPGGTNTPGLNFTVIGNEPVIESFTPDSGAPGSVVNLYGINFTGTLAVTFGTSTTSAQFTVKSDTNLVVTVPNGAATGALTVRNASGTGRSLKNFTVGTSAALSLSATANPFQVLPNQPLVLQLRVHDSGPLPAAAVNVTVKLPDGLDYLDSTLVIGSISLLVDGFSWDLGDVGANQDILGYIRIQPRFTGVFSVTAKAASSTPDPSTNDNSASVTITVAQPALRVVERTPNLLTLGWPATAQNYFLQRTTQLGDGLWDAVTNEPIAVQDELQVDVPLTSPAVWYRLGPAQPQ